jgi:PqqD family protein of HPr-rel-A system
MPSRLDDLAISRNGFVFDPMTGASFSLNAAGMAMLEGLKEGQGKATILQDLRGRFAVPETGADLGADLEDFVDQLKRHGLVPRDFRA